MTKRLYSLYEVKRSTNPSGDPRVTHVRVSRFALPLKKAREFWQNRLLDYALHGGPERELRPVRRELTAEEWASPFLPAEEGV